MNICKKRTRVLRVVYSLIASRIVGLIEEPLIFVTGIRINPFDAINQFVCFDALQFPLSFLFIRLPRRSGGGIGRHVRLRGVWRKPCGFESHSEHHLEKTAALTRLYPGQYSREPKRCSAPNRPAGQLASQLDAEQGLVSGQSDSFD